MLHSHLRRNHLCQHLCGSIVLCDTAPPCLVALRHLLNDHSLFFCAAPPCRAHFCAIMLQCPLGLARMCQLLLLLATLLSTLPVSPDKPTGTMPPGTMPPGTMTPDQTLHRSKRGYISRPILPSASSESLYGWDCHSHPHLTKVFSFGRRRRMCPKDDMDAPQLTTAIQTFSVFQYRHTVTRRLLSCSLKVSRLEGRCKF